MAENFRGGFFGRDALPTAMTQLARQPLEPITWQAFVRRPPPPRGGAIGSWSTTLGDPLPEVLVVRDEDFVDTLAWLNAFFSGLAPVTQWCRVLSQSQAERVAKRSQSVGLGRTLGSWVGAILAECSVQAGGVQSLRDIPGSAAMSSASFAAGRAAAIWSDDNDFLEIASRHDELTQSLRDGSRPIPAQALVPLWSVLAGHIGRSVQGDRRALEPVIGILSSIAHAGEDFEPAEVVERTAVQARDSFDLVEIADCARGPQLERVRALDRLGERLSAGPRSPSIEALLGLGASFVDPGAAVSPELLRRYGRSLPLAPIWQGVFAGALAPLRVMTDQTGLGRLVAKALIARDDLHGRPTCDIAYDELVRWITPGRPLKVDIRAMSARVLAVELVPGVTSAFASGRTEATITAPYRSDAVRGPSADRSRHISGRTLQDIDLVVHNLQERVERLEAGSTAQASLDLRDTKEIRNRKARIYSNKSK